MTQKQIFLKNIVDSTMSISLDQSVSVETLDAFHFNNKAINEKSIKFEYILRNSETKYFFSITFYKTSKKGFFGSDKSQFYLRIDTRMTTQYSSSSVGTDFITNETGDIELLKRMFNFLNDRIEEKRIKKEEDSYLLRNKELVKFIDKSLTRDEKLKDLLQDK
jgi:hypothetical protein